MATKFSVWIDTPSTAEDGNIQDSTTFAGDTQRVNGFQSGTAASSKRVNTALREATLVITAIMKKFANDSTVDVSSTVDQVVSALSAMVTSTDLTNAINDAIYDVLNTPT